MTAPKGAGRRTASRPSHADDLLSRAERLIENADARKVEAEVYIEQGRSLDADLEKGVLAGMSSHASGGGAWRVVKGGRLGFAYFADDTKALAALEAALGLTKLAPNKKFHLPHPTKPARIPTQWDADVAEAHPNDAITLANDVLRGAREVGKDIQVTGGGASLSWGAVAIANTHGVRAATQATDSGVSASITLAEGERSISTWDSQSSKSLDVDGAEVGRKAATTAMTLRRPKKAKGGKRDIVFRPEAGLELVAGLAVAAATGDEAMRGKTVWSGKLGKRVAAPSFSLIDAPLDRAALGATAFDDEGTATRRVPIVEKGVLRNYLFDCWDANEHRRSTTASAVRGGWTSKPGTDTHHLVVEGPSSSFAKLLSDIDEGFLVESVLGAHTANETTGEFSVTAPNVWRIHQGEVSGAVSEIAIAGDMTGILGAIDGVSKELKRMDGASMPYVRVRGMSVSV